MGGVMFGTRYIAQSITDESGSISSARINSYIAAAGFFLFGALAVMFAFMGNQMGVTACVTLAGVAFGKSAADMMAAQKKSGVVLAAQATASASVSIGPSMPPTGPSPSPVPPSAPVPTQKGDPREHDKRVLAIMRLSFVPRAAPIPVEKTSEQMMWTLRPSASHVLIKDNKPHQVAERTNHEQEV